MSRKYTDRDHALILGSVFQSARLTSSSPVMAEPWMKH